MRDRESEIVRGTIPLNRQSKQCNVHIGGSPLCGYGMQTTGRHARVRHMFMPDADTAENRVVRMEELLRARHVFNLNPKIKKYSPLHAMCVKTIDDMVVHRHHWVAELGSDMSRKINRDLKAAALETIRAVSHLPKSVTPNQWNTAVCETLRALSMLASISDGDTSDPRYGIEPLSNKRMVMLGKFFDKRILDRLLSLSQRTGSKAMLTDRKFRLARLKTLFSLLIPPGGLKRYKKHPSTIHNGFAKKVGVEMNVYEPPRNEPCEVFRSKVIIKGMFGGKLNYGHISKFSQELDVSRLFKRHVYKEEGFRGTVLIDASGSMGVSPERLASLCKNIPAATVAYYSGGDEDHANGACGDLVVYAKDKMRVDQGAPHHHGGNGVDGAAIAWLLEQEGPHVLVSDQGFGGGRPDNAIRAVMYLRMNPEIKVIDSIEEAWPQLVGREEGAAE